MVGGRGGEGGGGQRGWAGRQASPGWIPERSESMGATYLFKDKGNGKGRSCQGVPGVS